MSSLSHIAQQLAALALGLQLDVGEWTLNRSFPRLEWRLGQLVLARSGHPRKSASAAHDEPERPLPERVAGMDQVLGTRDIERITGRHRCTVYRQVCAGTFPQKRAGDGRGWLRSDVERWLSGGGQNQRQSSGGLGTQP